MITKKHSGSIWWIVLALALVPAWAGLPQVERVDGKLSKLAAKSMVTSVAIGDDEAAWAFAGKGIARLSFAGTPFWLEPKWKKVLDMAYFRTWLLVATDNGLHVYDTRRGLWVVHLDRKKLGFADGAAHVLHVRGGELFVGGTGHIALVNLEQNRVVSTFALPDRKTAVISLLALGGQLYVGTEGKGLHVLDLGQGAWRSWDRFDGLAANQVTGLELVGRSLAVSTAQGLAFLDLATGNLKNASEPWIITHMTQFDGALLLSTLDGLVLLEGANAKPQIISGPKKDALSGKVAVRGSRAVGSLDVGAAIMLKWPQSPLSPLRGDQTLDSLKLQWESNPWLASDSVVARIWYPERPQSPIPLRLPKLSGTPVLDLVLPHDLSGYAVLELEQMQNGKVARRGHLAFYRDRTPPVVELEPIPPHTKNPELKLRGRILERALASVEVLPQKTKAKIDGEGVITANVKLQLGVNKLSLVARDKSGNVVQTPFEVILDTEAPKWKWPVGVDTVPQPNHRLQIPFTEANLREVNVMPSANASVLAADSILLVTLRDLKAGENRFRIEAEDLVGHKSVKEYVVVFQDEREKIVAQMRREEASREARLVAEDQAIVRQARTDAGVTESDASCAGEIEVVVRLRKKETLRELAYRFYGRKDMYMVIALHNGIRTHEEMTSLEVGREIRVPLYTNFVWGKWNVSKEIERFEQRSSAKTQAQGKQ